MIFNPVYGGDGGSAPVLGTKTITANGTYTAASDNLDGYDEVIANVPNTYAAADEGKVVSNGALAAQTSRSVTANGTYDTTLNNEVVVNVSGGGSTLITKTITANGTYNASDDNADGYSSVTVDVQGGGGSVPFLHNLLSYYGDAAGTSTTSLACQIAGVAGSKALLIVMHRDTISVPGMTLIDSTKSENYNQWISVFERIMASDSEIVTITQNSSVRMCAASLVVNADTSLSAPIQQEMDDAASTYRYTITPSSKVRLAVVNNAWAGAANTGIVPTRIALPNSLMTSTATVRFAVFIAQDVKPIVYSVGTTADASSRLYNRLFLYDIS